MRDRLFYGVIAGFAFGVALETVLVFGVSFSALFALLALVFFAYAYVHIESRRFFFVVACVCFSVGLGVFRMDASRIDMEDIVYEKYVDQQVVVYGRVSQESDVRENTSRLTVEIQKVENPVATSSDTPLGFSEESMGGVRVLVVTDRYSGARYGDEVEIRGIFEKPENFENEGTRVFDYVSYLQKDGIYYEMYRPQIVVLERDHAWSFRENILSVKHAFLDSIGKVIPEPEVSLLGGLVVGAKRSLGEQWLTRFREVGLIHIVVLSGYNITLVADFIMRLLQVFPRAIGYSFGSLGIVLFALLTGAGATVVRASIMAVLVIVARATGRSSDMIRLLFVAGFGMIMWNPQILLYDPSFQLSFLATFGLLTLGPKISEKLWFITEKFQMREIISSTLATQLFVLPALLYMVGELSLVALPANILVLAFIPLTMFLGFVAGMTGFISVVLSLPFAYGAYVLLSYELKVVEVLSRVPYAVVSFEAVPLWIVFVSYIVIIVYVLQDKTEYAREAKSV